MKSLRDYTNLPTDHEGISWGGAFPTAIHGLVNGVKARAITPGNLPGASTILLCADDTGFLQEVKRVDFQVTDGAYLPLKDAETIGHSTR